MADSSSKQHPSGVLLACPTISNRQKVDHTYRDLSPYLQKGGEVAKHKKSGSNFPAKLHQMLSDPELSLIISWMPHGRTFKIIKKELLTSRVIPEYFGHTKFESFTRQLSGWGFKRLYSPGPDLGCYYHEFFLRGLSRLTGLMRRVRSNQKKTEPFPEGEPDFYRISNLYPVPPDNSECSSSYAATNLDSAPTATPSSNAHDSLMPVVHSYAHQSPGPPTNMFSTLMSNLQAHETTSWSNVTPNQTSLKASRAVEAAELALKSSSSLEPIAMRQADAASNTMYTQPASNIQAQDCSNHGHNAMLQNMAMPPQGSTLNLAEAAAATNAPWASMTVPTIHPSTIMGAQNEMMPAAQVNLSEISRAYTMNETLSASIPCISTHAKNTEFAASISAAGKEGSASVTRIGQSSDTAQTLLGLAESSMASDVGAVSNISSSINQSAQPPYAAVTVPVGPSAASTFSTNQAPSQYSMWPFPPPRSNIDAAYFSNGPSAESMMAAMFPEASLAASNSMNNQLTFQHLNASLLSAHNAGQSNVAYSSGSTEFTSTETTTPNDSDHQFKNIQGRLESSHQDQEDAKSDSDRSSFDDEISTVLD